jgi:hypothetical protein
VQVIGSVCSQDATGDCVDICESENEQECKTSPLHGACQTLPFGATEPYERDHGGVLQQQGAQENALHCGLRVLHTHAKKGGTAESRTVLEFARNHKRVQ